MMHPKFEQIRQITARSEAARALRERPRYSGAQALAPAVPAGWHTGKQPRDADERAWVMTMEEAAFVGAMARLGLLE